MTSVYLFIRDNYCDWYDLDNENIQVHFLGITFHLKGVFFTIKRNIEINKSYRTLYSFFNIHFHDCFLQKKSMDLSLNV